VPFVPPPPPDYDKIEFQVSGKTYPELRGRASEHLTKLLGVRPENPHFDLDIHPLLETVDGEIVSWIATVTARVITTSRSV
jgi:hypothetical protein